MNEKSEIGFVLILLFFFWGKNLICLKYKSEYCFNYTVLSSSGGEPFYQAEEVKELARALKDLNKNLDIYWK